jgi:hypothetical protein
MANKGWSVTSLFCAIVLVKVLFYEDFICRRQISSNQQGGLNLWEAVFAGE